MRYLRRSLPPSQQRLAARKLARTAGQSMHLRFKHRWAIYLSNDGEIDPIQLQLQLNRHNRPVFLPVLHPVYHNRLWFVRFDKKTPLVRNKYGIFEPSLKKAKAVPVWTLNVICLPLVAFDGQGHRLGMGGGYYDRSFSKQRLMIRAPLLIGTAHSFQQVSELPAEVWDIPLDAVITEQAFLPCNPLSGSRTGHYS